MRNFIKFRSVGVELFHADGRTNMTKLTVAFRKFVIAPKTHYCVCNKFKSYPLTLKANTLTTCKLRVTAFRDAPPRSRSFGGQYCLHRLLQKVRKFLVDFTQSHPTR